MKPLRFPFFYGWVIVGSAFVLLALAYTAWYSFSVFLVAILEEYGWSRALTAGVFSVFTVVHGLTGPLIGGMVDRRGPRLVVGVGAMILAAGLIGSSRISEPWQFYLFFGVVAAMGVGATGWIPNFTLLQNWFVRRLGTVVGIASGGVGFGILFLVPLAQYAILHVGWRITYVLLAAAVLAVMLPTTLLFQRRRPQDMGLLPDDSSARGEERRLEAERLVVDREWASRDWTLRSAVRTYRFWMAFGAGMLLSFASQMVLVHHVALLVDAGYDKMLAASAVGMVGIASVFGKLLWGSASDRVGREVAFTAGMSCALVGILLLMLAQAILAPWVPYVYGAWMGIGYAVSATLAPTLSADLFRGRSFGAIFGLMGAGNSIGGALGSWVAGYIFDLTGDYMAALSLGLVAILASIVCLWLAGPRKVRLVPGQARQALQRARIHASR